jgi:hypothetical protein
MTFDFTHMQHLDFIIFLTSKITYFYFPRPIYKYENWDSKRWETSNRRPFRSIILCGQSRTIVRLCCVFCKHNIFACAPILAQSHLIPSNGDKFYYFSSKTYCAMCQKGCFLMDTIVLNYFLICRTFWILIVSYDNNLKNSCSQSSLIPEPPPNGL